MKKIIDLDAIPDTHFQSDFFQKSIEANLYLECILGSSRTLISPDFKIIPVGPVTAAEKHSLLEAVGNSKEKLRKLKEYIIYQLSVYSSLLETNSYFICLNKYLTMCRFVSLPGSNLRFEIKLYTIAEEDLPLNYKDRLFIGRDFISLTETRRDYLGLKNIQYSLREQIKKLNRRCKDLLSPKEFKEIENEYLKEIDELFQDTNNEMEGVFSNFPANIDKKDIPLNRLLKLNRRFRDIKHILIDIEGTAREMQAALFKGSEPRTVRHVSKLSKDISNYINYIMSKINGRISDTVNGIHILEET